MAGKLEIAVQVPEHDDEIKGKLNRLFEGSIRAYPGNASLIQYFYTGFEDQRVKKDALALIEEVHHHTYQALDEVSTWLAALIKQQITDANLQNLNPDEDTVIGVCIPPSDKLIFTLFAILKLGAAYVPFDTSFPEERVVKIVTNCRPILIISDSHQHTIAKFDPVVDQGLTKVVSIDDLLTKLQKDTRPIDELDVEPFPSNFELFAERIALILYTSGSSGAPKGVRLSHRTILNRLHWQWQEFPYTEGENFCFKTALTFVDSVPEIFGPLLQGYPLYIFDKKITSAPNMLVQRLDDFKITRLVLVPSLLRAMLHTLQLLGEEGKTLLSSLKLWVCSGETLPKELLVSFFERFPTDVKLCNFYGSTEIMGDVTAHTFGSMKDVETNTQDVHVPIGNCIYNTVIYIMDNKKELVPEGDSGELYVAGHNLATGYVGLPNSEKFVENPFTKTQGFARLFRTGDFGHIHKPKDGIRTLFYDGRIDSQIKVRGVRLDLSEIEATINAKQNLVQKAVVLCYKPGTKDQTIIAFIIPQEGVTASRLDMMCKLNLRPYEVPGAIKVVFDIPLLVNGKVDRQRLLESYADERTNRSPFDGWHTLRIPEHLLEITKKVVNIMSEVTGRSEHELVQDLDDSFYNVGGTSLNSVVMVTKLHENGLSISLPDFINAKSIRNITEIIESNKKYGIGAEVGEGVSAGGQDLYLVEPLQAQHEKEATNIIAYSFSAKGDLEKYTHATYDEFVACVRSIWAGVVAKGFSFVVRRKKDKKIIAVGLNFDMYDEPTNTIVASQGIHYCFELLEFVEKKQLAKLPKGPGKLFHSFMMGTHEVIDDADNVILIAYMEEENIVIAVENKFTGILTTNTNPLTQQVCGELYGYETLCEYQINQFEAKDGKHPFKLAPDTEKVVCAWKQLSTPTEHAELLPRQSQGQGQADEVESMDEAEEEEMQETKSKSFSARSSAGPIMPSKLSTSDK